MAADGTPLLCASAFAAAVDGITTVLAYDDLVEELASRRDSVAAKKGRNGALERREEADVARGWSSAVVERGLALRRRGGSASFCRPRGGFLVGTAAATSTEERSGRRGEAGASCPLGGVGAEAEEAVVDPGVAFFCLAVL